MKKLFYLTMLLTMVLTMVLASSCKEEVQPTDVHPIAKKLFTIPKTGSEYTYYDRITLTDVNVVVTDYIDKNYSICNSEKLYTKGYIYNLGGKACEIYATDCKVTGPTSISMSIPTMNNPLILNCDVNGKFDCDSSSYMETYDVNGYNFKGVYYFEKKAGANTTHYYYAENVGLIYVYDDQRTVSLKLVNFDPTDFIQLYK
ncbi:MAG: hypothetical protein RR034_04595 [Bacteroidales bacterium]